jgi:hypothetical protein
MEEQKPIPEQPIPLETLEENVKLVIEQLGAVYGREKVVEFIKNMPEGTALKDIFKEQ